MPWRWRRNVFEKLTMRWLDEGGKISDDNPSGQDESPPETQLSAEHLLHQPPFCHKAGGWRKFEKGLRAKPCPKTGGGKAKSCHRSAQ